MTRTARQVTVNVVAQDEWLDILYDTTVNTGSGQLTGRRTRCTGCILWRTQLVFEGMRKGTVLSRDQQQDQNRVGDAPRLSRLLEHA